MTRNDPNSHPVDAFLDRFAEGDLSAPESASISLHLESCAACRRQILEYRAFFAALDRLPAPHVPPGFSVRILDAVLPKPAEDKVLLRIAAKLYASVAVALSVVAAAVLGMSGPGPVTWAFAQGFSRSVEDGFATLKGTAIGGVDLVLAILELAPLAGAARSLLKGFETLALALPPQHIAILVLTLSLATLVLIWAMSPARERGVPHGSFTL